MSKLFEIHVLRLIRTTYKEGVYYQKKYAERIPDIVINRNDLKLVVDVKYKPYAGKTIEIEDIRQIAAYARMKSIFKDLRLQSHDILDSLIIYPKVESKNQCIDDTVLSKKAELQNYFNIYKLEVVIPTINKN
jgi:5-methylcytosine-specific restriction endonuclease McrBC regulatory subunit McrC